jgi:glucan phosphoethanolaminetransferase (alkaline phosphatase superfamily)
MSQSFVIFSLLYTTALVPLLAILLRPFSLGNLQYIPSGPTPIIFALLAQYQAAIPFIYKYTAGLSPHTADAVLSLTDKSTSYFLPLQLALSQFPASVLPSLVGWAVGIAYRREILPGYSWRLPSRTFGSSSSRAAQQVESLRRRMEDEVEGLASGAESSSRTADSLRRR